MKSADLRDIEGRGENFRRIELNYGRLESEPYQPPQVFKDAKYDWPGDWEGRTILALVMLVQATHREPKYLAQIMEELPRHLNVEGYFGPMMQADRIDEQQLSGNGWFLRSLTEYYRWKPDPTILGYITAIVQNLYLRTKGAYPAYPTDPKVRKRARGGMIGHRGPQPAGRWVVSSDIGCAFIALDGLSQAEDVLHLPALRELLDEMIAKFLTIDLRGLSFQTHATLSATRGILRYSESRNDPALLAAAERIYRLYWTEALTENYENFNWFNRPQHTEACAIIDSFLVAFNLWRLTGKADYLEMAHLIYFNGMGYGQRPNGGFGCDICAGATRGNGVSGKDRKNRKFVAPSPGGFEAFWCCTMRGGEGLAKSLEYSFLYDSQIVILPFYNDATFTVRFEDGSAAVKETAGYPYEGFISLEIVESVIATGKNLKLYVPSFALNVKAEVNGSDRPIPVENQFATLAIPFVRGTRIQLTFDIPLRAETRLNAHNRRGYSTWRHGNLILGIDSPLHAVQLGNKPQFDPLGRGKYRLHGTDCREPGV